MGDTTNFLDLEVRSRIGDLLASRDSVEHFIDWFAANTLDDRTALVEAVESLLGEIDEFTVAEFVAALRDAAKPVEMAGVWTAIPSASNLRMVVAESLTGVVLTMNSSASRAQVIATPHVLVKRRDPATADT